MLMTGACINGYELMRQRSSPLLLLCFDMVLRYTWRRGVSSRRSPRDGLLSLGEEGTSRSRRLFSSNDFILKNFRLTDLLRILSEILIIYNRVLIIYNRFFFIYKKYKKVPNFAPFFWFPPFYT